MKAAGTAGGRPVRRAAAATRLAIAVPSANTKTGKSTTTSVVRACRGCQGAAVSLWAPPPQRPPPTRRALLQDPCPWQDRAVLWQGPAAAAEVSLRAPRRAVPAVPLAPRLRPPPPSWRPPLADARPLSLVPSRHTDATVPSLQHKNQTEESSLHIDPFPPPLI